MLESVASPIGQISFWKKLIRKRSTGNPNAAFDMVGAGNVLMSHWRSSFRPYQNDIISINIKIVLK